MMAALQGPEMTSWAAPILQCRITNRGRQAQHLCLSSFKSVLEIRKKCNFKSHHDSYWTRIRALPSLLLPKC